jgi:hypothetical protein
VKIQCLSGIIQDELPLPRIRLRSITYKDYLISNPIKIMTYEEPVEKVIFFRLIKNAQMQGARNPEE